jgi:hypothetical protein
MELVFVSGVLHQCEITPAVVHEIILDITVQVQNKLIVNKIYIQVLN